MKHGTEARVPTAVARAPLTVQTAVHKLNRKVDAHRVRHQTLLKGLHVIVPGILLEKRCKSHLVLDGGYRLVVDVVYRSEAVRRDGRVADCESRRALHEMFPGAREDAIVEIEEMHVKHGRLPGAEMAEPCSRLHQIDVGSDVVRHTV
jgi:hypothetical protein